MTKHTQGLAAFAALLVACSAFGASSDATPPAQGGGSDGGPATPTDASLPPSGDDGGGFTLPDGAPARFCATVTADGCADFDGPNAGGWGLADGDNMRLDPDGTLNPQSPHGENSTQGLRSSLAQGSNVASAAKLLSVIQPSPSRFTIEADVLVDAAGRFLQTDSVAIFNLSYGRTPNGANGNIPTVEARITVPDDPADAQHFKLIGVVRGGGGAVVPMSGGLVLPYGQWFHLQVTADIIGAGAQGKGSAEITVDQQAPLSIATVARQPPSGFTPAVAVAEVGLQRYAPTVTSAALSVLYDNVVGRAAP